MVIFVLNVGIEIDGRELRTLEVKDFSFPNIVYHLSIKLAD
jgi:hypothetical protein